MTRHTQSRAIPLAALARDTRAELERIIAWWSAKMPDPNGGFVSEIDAAGVARANADKAVVLNTRLLWFFSEAYAATQSATCRALADRAAAYVSERFFDFQNGGLFWMLDATGSPIDRRKQAYAQAFGVYAFAAHYNATGDTSSLNSALGLFDVLETDFLDREHGGYVEALSEDFSPVADMRLSERDLNAPKSMNAHLHVLEAYTALYRAAPSLWVADALESAFGLMMERVFDRESGHLALFFERDWRRLDRTVSFGHDVEASWLICEAAEALGKPAVRQRAQDVAQTLMRNALAEALGPNGEVFEGRDGDGQVSCKRVWWIQAEGLVGFINAFDLTGDRRYFEAGDRLWRFVQAHQIDHDGGEWRASSALDAPCDSPEPQAGPWKCPYHTGRAMMEVERRASALARELAQTSKPKVRT